MTTQPPPAAGPAASPHDSRGVAGQSFALNGAAGRRQAGSALRKGIGELLADAIELVELQVALLKLNTHQAKNKAIWPAAFLSAGAVLALAAIPLLLVAIAFLVHELSGLPLSAAFGITFIVSLLLGGLAAFIAFRQLMAISRTFDDSTAELSRNVSWLKSALRPGRPENATVSASPTADNPMPTDRDRYQTELREQWERQHAN